MSELNPTVDFVAGTVSGIAGLVVGYPFDTFKVRSQLEGNASWKEILSTEKLRGVFRGVGAPIATTAFMNGIVFSSYKLAVKLQTPTTPTLTQTFIAGAFSGIVASIITTPTELVKIRAQQAGGKDAWTVLLAVLRGDGGMQALYRGLPATALRDTGYGAYFWAYEAVGRNLTWAPDGALDDMHHENEAWGWSVTLVAGGVAGVAGWLMTFPFDVVKTRMQSAYPSDEEAGKYKSVWSTIRFSYAADGWRVFWRGLGPTLLRAIPVNMATFMAFEGVLDVLSP